MHPTYLMQFIPVGYEWIIIIIIGGLLFFGYKKIPEIARSFGRASTEFQKSRIEAERELNKLRNVGRENIDSDTREERRKQLETIANTLGIDYINKNDEELKRAIEMEINKSK
jgi:sec-independent protein translocase protein TatA